MPPLSVPTNKRSHFRDHKDFDAAQLLHLYTSGALDANIEGSADPIYAVQTDVVISAWAGPRLVAFGRVLTDYVYRATIWDVIVDRDYQRRHIGTEIVQRILSHPTLQQVELFWLCTVCPGFYERLGFSAKEQTGMVWSRKKPGPQR